MWLHGGFFYPFEDPHGANRKPADPDVLQALEHVRDWSLAVDGGAHVGKCTRVFLEKFGRVISFELAPDTTECLRKNCPDAEIHNVALGDKPGFVGYESDQKETSTVRRVIDGKEVPVIALDSLELPSCGFIKLDLQGYDYLALLGAEETIRAYHPVIIFEHKFKCFDRYGINAHHPQRFLKSCGYRDFKRTGPNLICYGEM
jgi:FkbM family methyltransferase